MIWLGLMLIWLRFTLLSCVTQDPLHYKMFSANVTLCRRISNLLIKKFPLIFPKMLIFSVQIAAYNWTHISMSRTLCWRTHKRLVLLSQRLVGIIMLPCILRNWNHCKNSCDLLLMKRFKKQTKIWHLDIIWNLSGNYVIRNVLWMMTEDLNAVPLSSSLSPLKLNSYSEMQRGNDSFGPRVHTDQK